MSTELIRLPVVVIKVADDDGSHYAGDAFSDETIRALIEDTNAIYEPDVGIRLILQKISTLNNTRINRVADWSMECPDAEATIPHPDPAFAGYRLSPSQHAAYSYAAKHYPDKIVIYVRRRTAVRVPVDAGYPKPLDGNWPGLPAAFKQGIDAALLRQDNGKIYLFKGSEYVRFSAVGAGVDPGYPKPIADHWPGLPASFQQGIDAALWRGSNGCVYLFKGSEYVRFTNVGAGVDPGYPKPIADHWPGLPPAFRQGIDAALYSKPTGQIYFFKNDEYVRFSSVSAGVDPGYPQAIRDNWRGLPETFEQGIQAALWRESNGCTYLFKGSEYVRYSKACDIVDEGGGGFSHKDMNFVALSPWAATGTLGVMVYAGGPAPAQAPHVFLAHELGHYFDLTHPMPNHWPQNQDEATQQLDDYCRQHYAKPEDVPENIADLVWNLDQLTDTPGDPGSTLYLQTLYGVSDPTAAANPCIGAGEFTVHSEYCGRDFTVKPARDNVMSYTAQCPYLPGNTTGQTRARITPQQRAVIHASLKTWRKNLQQLPVGHDRYNAVWIKSNEDRPVIWAWKRADFDRLKKEYDAKGFRLDELNAFVLPGGEVRYNAVWIKSNEERPAVWAWKRADFDKLYTEYYGKGYRPVSLNAFMLPDGIERFNAIWIKSNEDRPAVWSWKRADFDKLYTEYHDKGFRLIDLNTFVYPGGEERYNAVWIKSDEDRPAVWAWKRADFDKLYTEYDAKGYRPERLNAFLGADGELRYNALWVKAGGGRKALWDWVRWDFESRHDTLHAKGYRLYRLGCSVLP